MSRYGEPDFSTMSPFTLSLRMILIAGLRDKATREGDAGGIAEADAEVARFNAFIAAHPDALPAV